MPMVSGPDEDVVPGDADDEQAVAASASAVTEAAVRYRMGRG
jgi:hypothetical protein